jgi:hypothetical protein
MNLEKRSNSQETSVTGGSVGVSIPEADLPAYKQAAQELGIVLNVAEKGKPFSTTKRGTALVAQSGHVGVNYHAQHLVLEDGSLFDYYKFGIRVEEIKAQLNR